MKIAISVSVGSLPLVSQVERIVNVLQRNDVEFVIVLAGHSVLDPKGCEFATEAAAKNNNTVTAFVDTGSFSMAYLKGWQVALAQGADFIISMDADGSHDPEELTNFIDLFRLGDKVVCASRHLPGSKNMYPIQRKILSKTITLLANTLLVKKSQRLTDMASGYEGLSKDAVRRVFEILPAEKWISVTHGPYHLQNTILRLLLIEAGFTIREVPINYGHLRRGKVLPTSYVTDAIKGFVYLAIQKNRHFK